MMDVAAEHAAARQLRAPSPIRLLATGLPYGELHAQLLAAPHLWNRHRQRLEQYAHSDISDIWVRAAQDATNLQCFHEPHESVWYPAYYDLPALRPIIFNVMRLVEGERLGGVLITKIPPGASVKPHVDIGWHARYYDKFALQIAADEKQCFHFENASLVTMPGDLFTFDNSQVHWVTNDSDVDRITLIICIRVHPVGRYLMPEGG